MPLAFPPLATDLDAMGACLASARRTGTRSDVSLAGLVDLDAAEDVRDAALRSLG